MSDRPPIPFDYEHAIRTLSQADERLAALITKSLPFQLDADPLQSPYEALLEAIAYQSISGKAAATIFARIKALGANGRCPAPEEILRTPDRKLRTAGLSRAKAAAMKDLAQKTMEGVVPSLADAEKLTDEELVERLISVRGIGAWTVEMFLIFRLGRPDVLPIHDYGVQKGYALTYRKRRIPKPRELAKFGERWRPYRTVASWFMWRAVEHAGKDARKMTKKTGAKKKSSPPQKRTRARKRKRPGRYSS